MATTPACLYADATLEVKKVGIERAQSGRPRRCGVRIGYSIYGGRPPLRIPYVSLYSLSPPPPTTILSTPHPSLHLFTSRSSFSHPQATCICVLG
ncbi:hypothetical protein E2C01_089393 [Portunus trituberculatus]|uniref:Uncharacterized protein n=1 Tax=Portunus trituberculatus TaxID=210409 RepID=A0A5B7J8N7_PORTR|nr:hypothetical protein [Portunus trituberculatus]